MRTFNTSEIEMLREDLHMRIQDWLLCLEDDEDDEGINERINLLATLYGLIDEINIEVTEDIANKYYERQ